jgi:hypothetical protein
MPQGHNLIVRIPAGKTTCDDALLELTERVLDAFEAIKEATANALAAALDAGDALFEVKQLLQDYGIGWEGWLRDWGFCKLSTARLYMQLARHRTEIEIEMAWDRGFSIRAARQLIGKFSPAPATEIAGANIGPNSNGENERLLARVQELEHDKRRLEIENVGLRNEIAEMKAEFAAGRVLREVSNENFFSELMRRVSTGVWKKHQTALRAIRRALDSEHLAGPALDLKANSVSNDEATKH